MSVVSSTIGIVSTYFFIFKSTSLKYVMPIIVNYVVKYDSFIDIVLINVLVLYLSFLLFLFLSLLVFLKRSVNFSFTQRRKRTVFYLIR